MTPRQLVNATLDFQPGLRAPRDLWVLPGAEKAHGEALRRIREEFPSDIQWIGGHDREQPPTQGDAYRKGTYVDPWGCTFTNLQDGIVGEVKTPLVHDWERDTGRIHIPVENLTIDPAAVDRDCAATDRFTLGSGVPRPFEQLQFIRGSDHLLMDLADPSPAFLAFLARMHEFYCRQLTLWAATAVDALMFMDDWGSQRSLLISPATWRRLFKPLYADYARIAHRAGKRIFMHSDGHIRAIMPDLVEIGVDAVNAQLFCMGVETLKPWAGKITFWGEIDRQHLLPHGSEEDIDRAVREVHAALGQRGGCIAQCEFGIDAKPGNVHQVYRSWDAVTAGEAALCRG